MDRRGLSPVSREACPQVVLPTTQARMEEPGLGSVWDPSWSLHPAGHQIPQWECGDDSEDCGSHDNRHFHLWLVL